MLSRFEDDAALSVSREYATRDAFEDHRLRSGKGAALPGQKKFLLVIPDGAADLHRVDGRSPLAEAAIPYWDWLASNGVCGLMQTLYEDLPRGSIVAQLGLLGWNPYEYSGHGRSVWELLALEDVQLGPDDLVFRANLVRMSDSRLISYNAGFILSEQAAPLVERINRATGTEFSDFELHHNCDFRNSLVVRRAGVKPELFVCAEPHDHEGSKFEIARLIAGRDTASAAVAARINRYLMRVEELLAGEPANMIFPWSASRAFTLPGFRDNAGFEGRAAIVGCMDFLQGIAKVGSIDFFKVGNGRPDTDYAGKGKKVLELLAAGYSFVVCHVNSPDEAAHMHDRKLKVQCLEAIDRHVLGPIVEHFRARPEELGGLAVVPDHYTNLLIGPMRADAHSLHPVPFVIWNGHDRDGVTGFDETAVLHGRYGTRPVNHLELLPILGLVGRNAPLWTRRDRWRCGEILSASGPSPQTPG
jgi:2,3-bisphosphoglycerate-independent phosphoglycerate mutase